MFPEGCFVLKTTQSTPESLLDAGVQVGRVGNGLMVHPPSVGLQRVLHLPGNWLSQFVLNMRYDKTVQNREPIIFCSKVFQNITLQFPLKKRFIVPPKY